MIQGIDCTINIRNSHGRQVPHNHRRPPSHARQHPARECSEFYAGLFEARIALNDPPELFDRVPRVCCPTKPLVVQTQAHFVELSCAS